jgi:hypothetical protein
MARRKLNWINEQLINGRTVYLSTAYRAYKITRKNVDALSASHRGLQMQNGKSVLDVNGCNLSAR